ncbi:MAG: MFS transporter [Clostridia bacterium]|nr:MFS transporter [Clostridia bacterium]
MERKRINKSATQLFLLCFLSYACSYIGRKNFSACLPAMIAEEYITKAFGGYVTTAYMIFYGAGQLLNGIIGSRVKPKYMIGIGLMGAGICNLLMGSMPASTFMPAIWAANGLFHSMLWSPIIRIFTDLLPEERRSAAGTNIAASCSIGAVLAFLIPGVILNFGNWRVVFFVAGGLLLLTFCIWTIGNNTLTPYIKMMENACEAERQKLRENVEKNVSEQNKRGNHSLPALMIASGLWLLLFGLVCNGALRDAVESWAPTFLSEQFHLESSSAALISVMIPVISVTGTYVANLLHEKLIRNEIYTSCVMFAVASVCVFGLYLTKDTSALACAFFMAVSVTAMWGANHMFLTVIPYHFAPLGLSAAVTGLLNSVIYFATAIFSCIYGVVAEKVGWTLLIILWMGIGVAGILFCILGGQLWAKKRVALDEGRI